MDKFLTVDAEKCTGCRSGVNLCPFGAMNYHRTARQVFKCDLCGGDPQCVRFCDAKAVDFVASDVVVARKKRESVLRQSEAKGLHASEPA